MSEAPLAAVQRFHDAFNRHDLGALAAMLTEDCVFENTFPPPDGTRYEGAKAVRASFAEFFATSPQAHFAMEEMFAAGDRVVMRWVYRWGAGAQETGHVRGVDIFRLRNGKIAEKLSYVKG
jgi:ketosteroid isomerase-like protein